MRPKNKGYKERSVCAANRPGVESKTNEEEVEVQTETLSIKATPMSNGYVKAKTGDDTTDAVYQNWYSAVSVGISVPVQKLRLSMRRKPGNRFVTWRRECNGILYLGRNERGKQNIP